jgi:hypothetical protein
VLEEDSINARKDLPPTGGRPKNILFDGVARRAGVNEASDGAFSALFSNSIHFATDMVWWLAVTRPNDIFAAFLVE